MLQVAENWFITSFQVTLKTEEHTIARESLLWFVDAVVLVIFTRQPREQRVLHVSWNVKGI